MKQLYLNADTYDLEVTSAYQLRITTDAEALTQRIESRLSTFLGEWFLDYTIGVPYFDEVLIKQVDANNVNALLISVILETPEVEEILEYESEFETVTREFTFSFTVRGNSGIITSGSVSV